MRYLETPSGVSRLCGVKTALAWGHCAMIVGLVVAVGCSSSKPRARLVLNDAAVAGSSGSGGTGGATTGGTGGIAGSAADAAVDSAPIADATPDRTAAVVGPAIPCAVTVTSNTYDVALPGCGGVAMCKGVIGFMNNSPVTLNYPTIRFSVPTGVSCVSSHSASRWLIADDGAVSHQCVYTTNLLAIPWNIAPNGTFRFGYDVTAGVTPPLPTDFAIGDGTCPIPDGGLDGPGTDGTIDAQRDGQTLDARDGAGN
jgi:hypothetical protein